MSADENGTYPSETMGAQPVPAEQPLVFSNGSPTQAPAASEGYGEATVAEAAPVAAATTQPAAQGQPAAIPGATAASQPAYGQGYQQPGQQAYQQPTYTGGYGNPTGQPGVTIVNGQVMYPMTETNRTLRLVAFIFMLVSTVSVCWAIIPLAWMIPMTVVSWGIYKGTRPNTVAFGVCSLIFVSLVAGILLLVSSKDR